MDSPAILVAIPSLYGGPLLHACLQSLVRQSERDFEAIVIDNSGTGAIERDVMSHHWPIALRVRRSERNLGFAAAINQAWGMSGARYLATLNDDAEAHQGWLAALRREMDASPDFGMCASQVRLYGREDLDSAGMLMYGDGSSKQRGQGERPENLSMRESILLPSASAALYRREMLEDIGLFDADFFLYCEDTDLGLRARWNGWECRYVPDAVVEHHYSQSAGAASPLKAWQIERNRLWVAAKNFPVRMLMKAPLYTAARYLWHAAYLVRGRGAAAQFRAGGNSMWSLFAVICRAHWSLVTHFGELRRKRQAIRRGALISDKQFAAMLKRHSIPAREIARL